jgi:HAD-superfamily hydrolase, subfamily IIB
MEKLFCFDIDNTLLPSGQNSFPLAEKLILDKLAKKGFGLAIASGRNYDGIIQYLSKEQISSMYVIAGNGAAIYSGGGDLLEQHLLTLSDLYYFQKKYRDQKDWNIYALGRDNAIVLFREDNHTDFEISASKIKHVWFLDPEKFPLETNMPLLKVIIGSDKPLESSFLLTDNENDYHGVLSSPYTFEIMARGIDKTSGVEFLRKTLHVDKSEVYCFGDGGNDVGMLRDFVGVAMGKSTEECQRVAKFVTRRCEEDGVAFAINHLLKIFG